MSALSCNSVSRLLFDLERDNALSRSISYSQNFLKNPCLIAALLNQSEIGPLDVVYEIGPGKGIITEQLAQRCCRVIAVEKDRGLAELLRWRFAHLSNVTIIEGDFLRVQLPHSPYKVFANIPFNITTAIVTKLTSAHNPPDDAFLAMQREAVDKFLGIPSESLYAVLLKPWFAGNIVHSFRREDFMPNPRVDVVMLRLRKRGPPLISRADKQLFRDFVVYCFTIWRPTVASILKDIFTPRQLKHLSRAIHFDLSAPPSALTFEQWLQLFTSFKQFGNANARQALSGSERHLRKQQQGLQKIHRTCSRSKAIP
jgi:23S rRNA (adenine-N6)-dimethyltransferase